MGNLGQGTGAPQGPNDEHRLEEQSNESGGVGVEPEGIAPLDELPDVAGEDDDEEGRHHPADRGPVPHDQQEREAEGHFDDTRDVDDGRRQGHPRGNLGEEEVMGEKVPDPGNEKDGGQAHAANRRQGVC